MIHIASVWVTTCVVLLSASTTKKSGKLEKKLSDLLDDAHRTLHHGKNLHEDKLSSTPAAHRSTTPSTLRSSKFPVWHYMHDYSNETFEGQTVNYDTWRRPMPSTDEVIAHFREKYPRDKRPRYTKYNFTEIGSIFEQAFIDGEFNSKDYDYLRTVMKRNMSGIQITRSPFEYLTTRKRKFKPWKDAMQHSYQVDPDYKNEILGINTTWPAWLSTPINQIDDDMINMWMIQNNY
ncbi:hypothetical protein M8J76_006810 [Diaphorina citri]|nr:hypothetical protein M8J76_006810 [Diaphorina citri]